MNKKYRQYEVRVKVNANAPVIVEQLLIKSEEVHLDELMELLRNELRKYGYKNIRWFVPDFGSH